MLPQQSFVGATTANAILRSLSKTSAERVMLSNPFKDPEQLKMAFRNRVDTMIVQSVEEIEAIYSSANQNQYTVHPRLVWQFDETVDVKDIGLTFMLLRSSGINLVGKKIY